MCAQASHHSHATAELVKLTNALQTNDENWKQRMAALAGLRDYAMSHPEALQGHEATHMVHMAMETQVKDLRSAIVREACSTLVVMAQTLGNHFQKLATMLLPTLINLSASGNKVISGYVAECVHSVLQHTHVTRGIPAITDLVAHRSSSVRESCYEYLRVVLSHWPEAAMSRYAAEILGAIQTGLSDASATGRKTSRECFVLYRRLWPDKVARCAAIPTTAVRRLTSAHPNHE